MRAMRILLAALTLGGAGGYAWSMLASAPAAHTHLPKASMTAIAPSPEELPEEADKEWTAEASDTVQNAEAASPANVTE
jgi:hypothetical protein